MILARIVVQRHLRMVVEPLVDRRLRLGRHEMVGAGEVQHQRMGDRVLLAQQVGNADRVVADAGVGIGARRDHVGEPPAEAVADHADLRHAERRARAWRIVASISATPWSWSNCPRKLERALELGLDVGIELDPGSSRQNRSGASAR